MPFWAFALALSHKLDNTHFYRIPTLAELRLQVFSNLAYGAQAIIIGFMLIACGRTTTFVREVWTGEQACSS